MKWFSNSTVVKKLIGLTVILILLLTVTGIIGIAGVRRSNAKLETVYKDRLVPISQLSSIQDDSKSILVNILLSLMHDPQSEFHKLHNHPISLHLNKIVELKEHSEKLLQEYLATYLTPEEKVLSEKLLASRNRFLKEAVAPAISLLKEGEYDQTNVQFLTVANPGFSAMNKDLEALLKLQDQIAQQEYGAALADYRKTMMLSLVSILAGLVFGITFGTIITRSMGRSAKEVMEASSRLAEGDLTARAHNHGKDELGRIAESFNKIGESLSSVIGLVNQTAGQVAVAATQLSTTSHQMATCAEEVAAQAGTMATAGEEMAATAGEIARNCGMAAEESKNADETAAAGARIVENTREVMLRIAGKVKDSANSVESLGSRSDQIGVIIGTIEDIADQTNLLALNAAIEAARAGEHGRGFAVVADEVRALAERTTAATREIGEMIRGIQNETREAVETMEESVREVETGSSEAGRSGEALQSIRDQVSAVAMQVSQMATAAEQQTATTAEISNNILQITQVVQETARGAQESASSAAMLAKLSDDLQQLVGRFTLTN